MSNSVELIEVSGRGLDEKLETWYPEVSFAIRVITKVRMEGKELFKKRPNTLFRMVVSDWVVEIKPTVFSTPTGWDCLGAASIKMVGLNSATGRGIICRLQADGRLRLGRWFRQRDKTEEQLAVIIEAFDRAAADPSAMITQRKGGCGVCGRTLTDEVSMHRGIGPECWKIWDRVRQVIGSAEWKDVQKSTMAELRRLMQQFHPDKPDGDTERFIEARRQFEELRKSQIYAKEVSA